MDDEPVAKAPMRSAMTLVSQKPTTPFNASGSLGVVHNTPAVPVASTSNHNAADATSARPPVAPAKIPATIGSGLAAGATVVMVKRKKKEKGRMRAMAGRGKGKGKEIESDFDSSAESEMGTDSEGEKDDSEDEGAGSDSGSWKGIASDNEGAKVAVDVPAADDDEEEESEEESDETGDDEPSRPPREKGAFQAWAESAVLSAAGLTAAPIDPSPVDSDTYTPLLPAGSGFRAGPDPTGVTGPLGAIIPKNQLPTLPPQKSTHIVIERTEEMQKQRAELPIVKEEDRIMDAIRGNPVVVICGETGSGKTTQIGQFLWEAGWGDASSGESIAR